MVPRRQIRLCLQVRGAWWTGKAVDVPRRRRQGCRPHLHASATADAEAARRRLRQGSALPLVRRAPWGLAVQQRRSAVSALRVGSRDGTYVPDVEAVWLGIPSGTVARRQTPGLRLPLRDQDGTAPAQPRDTAGGLARLSRAARRDRIARATGCVSRVRVHAG